MWKFSWITMSLVGWLAAPTAANALTLTSPDIKPGAKMADEQVFNSFGCTGKNISPHLLTSFSKGVPNKPTNNNNQESIEEIHVQHPTGLYTKITSCKYDC